jgi:hypothetical protein
MVRRGGYLIGAWSWPAVLTLVGLIVGCGTSLTPEQTAAISKLQSLGGQVNFNHGGYEVSLRGTQTEDRDLVHLQKIPNLKTLDLQATRITDAGLAYLEPIQTLEYVVLSRTAVTDAGVENLKKSLSKTEFMQ